MKSINRAVTGAETSSAAAAELLESLLHAGSHGVVISATSPGNWPEWLATRKQSHRQVSDAALIVCALESDRRLATLDARLLDLTNVANRDLIKIIPL